MLPPAPPALPPATPPPPPRVPELQGQFCLQQFSATQVHLQNEGDHGISDPRLWIYEVQGRDVVFKTSVMYDTVNPTWPPTEVGCLNSSRTEKGVFCIDVRDDWPLDNPPLLNFGCVPLPESLGKQTVSLSLGCQVSFVVSLPPPPSPPRPPPTDLRGKLDVHKCAAMLRDPSHLFRKMWNVDPWWFRHTDTPTCFERRRDDTSQGQPAVTFFADVKSGANCDSNWFEGSPGALGTLGVPPSFSAMAPALLGFDESIEWFCKKEFKFFNNGWYGYDHAGTCANSNNNILALWGNHLVYNLCRNLEWQSCAAQGKLPGQGGVGMRFSYPPGNLDVYDGGTGKMLGDCRGWKPHYAAHACGPVGQSWVDAYSTDDIYFLEVCMFSFMCDNGADLFSLQPDDFYVCKFNGTKFDDFANLLMQPPTRRTGKPILDDDE